MTRDPEAVKQDVMLERYTHHQAKEWFGVIINPEGEIDMAATAKQRNDPAKQ